MLRVGFGTGAFTRSTLHDRKATCLAFGNWLRFSAGLTLLFLPALLSAPSATVVVVAGFDAGLNSFCRRAPTSDFVRSNFSLFSDSSLLSVSNVSARQAVLFLRLSGDACDTLVAFFRVDELSVILQPVTTKFAILIFPPHK